MSMSDESDASPHLHEIGFVGAGEMVSAMISGMLPQRSPRSVMASSPSGATKLDKFGIKCTSSNLEVFKNSKVVVIACKPIQVGDVLREWKEARANGQIGAEGVVSICAGVKLSDLAGFECPIIRVMPNLAVRTGAGTLTYCTSSNCSDEFENTAMSAFKPLGIAVKVQEKYFNAAQGISGCGPAFIAIFIESLVDAGVREGLSREVASKLAAQTVYGTGKLLLETDASPADLKYRVCSPGGVSIAGVIALEQAGFRSAVLQAHRTTIEKTAEIERMAARNNSSQ